MATSMYGMGITIVKDGQMALRISEVRCAINIHKHEELMDDVIALAVIQADAFVDSNISRPAPEAMIWLAKLRLAAYYAYTAYADRVFNELAGVFDKEGNWNPIGQAIWRETRDKLQALEKLANQALKQIGIDPELLPVTIPHFGTIR